MLDRFCMVMDMASQILVEMPICGIMNDLKSRATARCSEDLRR
ncbi:MAG: hypothetical protein OCU18_03510 [Candidatus Syntrophoarchaeum sp.]|nr:hypothetical protein [Candidatus Syntrophoarchaeum sp.]